MKTSKTRTFSGALLMLLGLVALFPLAVFAGGGNEGHAGGDHPGSDPDPPPPTGTSGGAGGGGPFAPGEGVGSLPQMPGADTPGLLLYGMRADVARTVAGITGFGDVNIQPYDPTDPSGPVVAVFSGDLTLRLDPDALAASNVAPFFYVGATFGSGSAIIGSNQHWSNPISLSPMQALPFPLEDLYSAGVLSSTLRIDAVSVRRDVFRMTVGAESGSIVVTQTAL